MIETNQPTGIIRTLPSLYGDSSKSAQRFRNSIAAVENGSLEAIYIALQAIPKFTVLHFYLLIEGEINIRLNIASFEKGFVAECWDETIRRPKYWAVCTAPVSRPPEPIKRRGFQGFRYTDDLW